MEFDQHTSARSLIASIIACAAISSAHAHREQASQHAADAGAHEPVAMQAAAHDHAAMQGSVAEAVREEQAAMDAEIANGEPHDHAAMMRRINAAKAAAAENEHKSPWGSSYFPNIPLTTHEGEQVRFFDDLIKDKVVAVNFIFTRCTDSCPLETARLREVTQILGDRVGRDVFFYSISIDPEHDTPEVLKAYTEQYGTPEGWKFLTGNEEDIILLRKRLGLYLEDIQGEDSTDHNLNMVIGNQSTGRWQKSTPFENPHVLATQLGSWLHNWKNPSNKKKQSYAKAPKLRNITVGEQLFRTRCSSCHTLGAAQGSMAAMRAIGPDLRGVTERREMAWLKRWLKEPDKMLAEQDPIATQMLAQYRNLAMPNLRLNQVEIAALIDYMANESDIADPNTVRQLNQ